MKSNQPTATIISGLSLSGKTTFLACLYQNGITKSKNITLDELAERIHSKTDFTIEVNLLDYELRDFVKTLKEAGYYVRVYAIHVDKVETAALNLLQRVSSGGKDALMRDVIKGYGYFSEDGYWRFGIIGDADEFYFYDNSENKGNPKLFLAYNKGVIAYRDQKVIDNLSVFFHRYSEDEKKKRSKKIEFAKNTVDQAMERSFLRLCQYYGGEWVEEIASPYKLEEGELIAYLVSTTNFGLSCYSNIVGRLTVTTIAHWTGDLRDETFRTSALRGYELEGSRLTLFTLNSSYVFEIVAGEFDKFTFTRANQEFIDERDAINNTKFDIYWCQIAAANPMINNAITVTALPYPMTLQEVRDYLVHNILVDGEGNIVTNVLQGYVRKEKTQ